MQSQLLSYSSPSHPMLNCRPYSQVPWLAFYCPFSTTTRVSQYQKKICRFWIINGSGWLQELSCSCFSLYEHYLACTSLTKPIFPPWEFIPDVISVAAQPVNPGLGLAREYTDYILQQLRQHVREHYLKSHYKTTIQAQSGYGHKSVHQLQEIS